MISHPRINVSILERFQATIDGYCFRLGENPDIEIRLIYFNAEDFLNELAKKETNVLITGISVRTSAENLNPFPILYYLEQFMRIKPDLKVLVISYVIQPQLIESLIDLGVNGFINKEDNKSIQNLATIVRLVADGGTYFSQGIQHNHFTGKGDRLLTKRQTEVLYFCSAYPDESTFTLGKMLNVSGSTLRNILSSIYLKLNVRTRTAAIMKAKELGILPTDLPYDPTTDRDNCLS
jgi:two-component system uhpT operon response regulator UhpA